MPVMKMGKLNAQKNVNEMLTEPLAIVVVPVSAARTTIMVGPLTGKDMWAQICHGAYFLKNQFYCIGLMKY